MEKTELKKILKLHAEWLKNNERGKRANLSGANLSGADLSDADLSDADLSGANLNNASLNNASLNNADLRCASLNNASLNNAILRSADLSGANLSGADLSGADLRRAILSGADLSKKDKNRLGVILPKTRIGYKKLADGSICELSIPKGAVVFSINGSKCRTNKCKVLKGNGYSTRGNYFEYKEGKKIEIKDFDLAYNVECSTGIHFFWTREEAEG